VTSWCPYCRKAREFLARQPNLRVAVHDIEENRTRHAEMLSKTGGDRGVPVIDVEGIVLQGYSAEALTGAISAVRAR
jgi:glutaredoxin